MHLLALRAPVRLTGTFTYDTDYREIYISTAKTGLNVQILTLDLDNMANPTLIYDTVDSTRTQTLTYDADYRLSKAIGKYGTNTYTYDADGNRLTKIAGGTTTTYTYPGTSNLLSATSGGAAATYMYDAAGNTINDTTGSNNTYTYEKRGRYHNLTVGGTVTATYLYDALGMRVSKQAGGVTTHYHYDEHGHIIEESNGGTGAMTMEYVWLNDMPLAEMDSSGNVYYVHNDQLGNPQKITDSTPTIVWDRVQQPFGEQYSLTSTITSNLRFPGQYFDSESGFFYNTFRDYNPSLGRYIETDPIGWTGASTANRNSYGYAKQNPVRFIDPTGLMCLLPEAIEAIEATPEVIQAFEAGEGATTVDTAANTAISNLINGLPETTSSGAGNLINYTANGGMEAAQAEFDTLASTPGATIGEAADGTPIVELPNGSTASLYPNAESTSGPTIQITQPSGPVLKIRF